MTSTISREFWFSAAHRIEGHPKCGRMHGHNYKVVVYLRGVLNKQGMVLDFGEVDRVLKPVIDSLDHYTLFSASNIDAEPDIYAIFNERGWAKRLVVQNTTAEELAIYLHRKVCETLKFTPNNVKVLVQETPRNDAIYEG
jgi:6-pyruvoyltetrahydropterin/6-carboxytetrahydropterin synthase